MNLLEETIADIERADRSSKDIVFIGSLQTGHCCSWEEFVKLADFEYDNEYSRQAIAADLVIIFNDGTKMWRREYDGSERWEYSMPVVIPTELKPIKRLHKVGKYYKNLEYLNDD